MSLSLERYYGPALRPFGKLSKPVKLVSEKHLKWIREQQCLVCGITPCDADHLQRKSQIRNDYCAIPLCHGHHMQRHNIGIVEFQEGNGVDLEEALIAKLIERLWMMESK